MPIDMLIKLKMHCILCTGSLHNDAFGAHLLAVGVLDKVNAGRLVAEVNFEVGSVFAFYGFALDRLPYRVVDDYLDGRFNIPGEPECESAVAGIRLNETFKIGGFSRTSVFFVGSGDPHGCCFEFFRGGPRGKTGIGAVTNHPDLPFICG